MQETEFAKKGLDAEMTREKEREQREEERRQHRERKNRSNVVLIL